MPSGKRARKPGVAMTSIYVRGQFEHGRVMAQAEIGRTRTPSASGGGSPWLSLQLALVMPEVSLLSGSGTGETQKQVVSINQLSDD